MMCAPARRDGASSGTCQTLSLFLRSRTGPSLIDTPLAKFRPRDPKALSRV